MKNPIPDEIADKAITLQDQFFDLRGLSAYSSLAVPTLRSYIRAGGLPHYRLRGKLIIKRSEFDTWMEQFRVSKALDLETIAEEAVRSVRAG